MRYLFLISLLAFGGCAEKNENLPAVINRMTLGIDFHYGVPHGVGHKLEDPTNGCPCVTIALGWDSYATMTNAFAHGVTNFFEVFEAHQKQNTNEPIRLDDMYKFQKQLVEGWKVEGDRENSQGGGASPPEKSSINQTRKETEK